MYMRYCMKKNTKKQLFNISIVIILALVTILTLLGNTDELNFSNLKSFFTNLKTPYIILAFVCWGGFILFEALSLHIILKTLGYKPKIKSTVAYAAADTYYSAITPSASGGQPASAYYMIRDGISGGTAGFSLIFNLIGYTAAILIIGLFALLFGFDVFLKFPAFVKFLVIIGFIIQILLLLFFISCMRYHNMVKKLGYLFVKALHKIKIIRKEQKWLIKVDTTIEKYRGCYEGLKEHKMTFVPVILCNVAQRTSQIMISAFVCKAAIDCKFLDILMLQSFVLVGYNSLPLPGGSGVFEYLYVKIYSLILPTSFIIVSVIFTRFISYYFSLIMSGIYTLIYHIHTKKTKIQEDVIATEIT